MGPDRVSSVKVIIATIALGFVVVYCDEFKIGYLTNIHGRTNTVRQGLVISGAITYAIDKIKYNSSLLSGHTLRMIYNDTHGDKLRGTQAVIQQWSQGAVAFFGPEDSCDVEATVAASLNLPMISYKCADSKVSKKEFYSTFARTQPPNTRIVRSVFALLRYYQWYKFSIIYENIPLYKTVVHNLEHEVKHNKNFTMNSKRTFENHYSCCEDQKPCCTNPFHLIIEETYRGTRVYIFIGSGQDLEIMMKSMRMKGLLNGQYVVLYVDLETYSVNQSYKYFWRSPQTHNLTTSAVEAARSLLVIVQSPPSRDYSAFVEKVREYNKKPPFNFPSDTGFEKHITIFAAYLYDAVMLYAEALDDTLKKGESPTNGTAIIRKIVARKKYLSVTGTWMQIDQNGDVEGNFTVLARLPTPENLTLKGINDSMRPKFTMLPAGNFYYDEHSNIPEFKLEKANAIDWVGGRPPLQEPPCGFDGSGCRGPTDKNREIIAGVLVCFLIAVSLIAAVTYRNWKYEQEIAGLLWRIDLQEIKKGTIGGLVGTASRASLVSQLTLESRIFAQIFTQTGIYKGTLVAVKQLSFSRKTADIPRETKKEMKMMREIHHDNINPFIGACVEPSCIYILSEYCAKGSLQDILENDDVKLDAMFIASLVFDLIQAMTYLHESDLKVHGNLKSSNCLVTSRWVLRVTDFGLHELRASAEYEYLDEEEYFKSLLWKAPELLRQPTAHPKGTQKGDVYSFAVILHEIIARQGTYGFPDMTVRDIVQRVKKPRLGEEPFRPLTYGLECQDYILQTMRDCWSEKTEVRPDFPHIRQRLNRMRVGMKSNIMDNVMAMMEKYANNLEELVEERTSLLVEEKKKTEALLHRMLPKPVATQLMRGEAVVPESYDAVTIYFSDIVGFTEMSATSTPMEVVTFLNDLYTVFDAIISHYDVYKVETIGDAYMVVSGLPIRNGDQHAAEIASMSLELLESIRAFKIRHKADDTLKLRIGMHTGPVVSGVVGLTMPRYCLFGDTVNTASRMESNGEALKIHVSPICREYLEKLGGYRLEERGLVKMKGKGELLTYWLMGYKEGKKHRHGIKDILALDLFGKENDIRRRSPKLTTADFPRRSSFAVRQDVNSQHHIEDSTTSLANNVHGPPAFLRVHQDSPFSGRRSPPPKDSRIQQLAREAELNEKNADGASCGDVSGRPTSTQQRLMMIEEKRTSSTDGSGSASPDDDGSSPQDMTSTNDVHEEQGKNGFLTFDESVKPLLNPKNHGGGLHFRQLDSDRNNFKSTRFFLPSKKWRSCDEIALPPSSRSTLRGLFSGLFANRFRDLDLGRRGSNASVTVYRQNFGHEQLGESAV